MPVPLIGKTILVVEDNYDLAWALETALRQMGAKTLGPFPSVEAARRGLDETPRPDAGLLDVNLGGEDSFPLVDDLIAAGIPVILLTGYDVAALPVEYRGLPSLQKPFVSSQVLAMLQKAGVHAPES